MNKFRLITIIILLFFGISNLKSQKKNIEYQNDNLIENLGIGLVQAIKANENIKFYSDKSFTKKIIPKTGDKLVPILNKPDYGILFFVCTEKTKSYYKIAISKNIIAYIKPSEDILFYYWSNFLMDQVSNIKTKNIKENPPRESINGKIINIKNWKDDDEIEILKIQNYWVQIRNLNQKKIFWLQWRDEKKLKVYLNLLM